MTKLAIAFVLFTACAWDSPNKLETSQPGMPCGAAWSPCTALDGGSTGMCCPNGSMCRTDGTCEDVSTSGASRDRVRQRPAK